MFQAYIALGSNLNDPLHQVKIALQKLSRHLSIELVKISSLYRSQPLGSDHQPEYINAVIEIKTTLAPENLLRALQILEDQQGRIRGNERWASRTLDLDILLYENEIIDTVELKIPHPELKYRDFVLYPLAEIAPDLTLPTGEHVSDLKELCEYRGLIRIY